MHVRGISRRQVRFRTRGAIHRARGTVEVDLEQIALVVDVRGRDQNRRGDSRKTEA